MTRKLSIICFSVLTSVFCDHYHPRVTEDILRRQKRSTNWQPESASHWAQAGRDELDEALFRRDNKKLAKNIVIVVGDGMSLSTVTGGRIYKGQRAGQDGASSKLAWDKFPNVGERELMAFFFIINCSVLRIVKDIHNKCDGARQRRHSLRHVQWGQDQLLHDGLRQRHQGKFVVG